MNKHLKPFSACEAEDRQLVDMAFNKKKADDRKEWLRQFQVRIRALFHSLAWHVYGSSNR